MPFDRLRTLGLNTSLILVAVTMPVSAQVTEYEETCEASAAVSLDDHYFAVANDETEKITIYDREKRHPVARFELPVDVTDIEAAARIGDTVFWLTSHSLNKNGKDKPERKFLIATKIIEGPSLKMVGQPYTELRHVLLNILSTSEKTRSDNFKKNLEDRLNVEGLAATGDGGLLVGLRGPLTDAGTAIVVRLDDPFGLVGLPRPISLPAAPTGQTSVVTVDLAGRGIRSMERVGEGQGSYLIAAGPEPDGGLEPLLFWWNGLSEKGTKGPQFGPLAGTVPEALIAWSSKRIQLLGDNGDRCTDKPKFKARRWFPSNEIDVKNEPN